MSPEVLAELQQLLSALCDGDLSEAQHARLEQLLQADAQCRRYYLEYLDMHARLLVRPQVSVDVAPCPDEPSAGDLRAVSTAQPAPDTRPLVSSKRRFRQALRYGLVAVTTLAASFLVQAFWWPGPRSQQDRNQIAAPEPISLQASGYVATLTTQTADCVWKSTREPLPRGARLLPGELGLEKGIARVRFDSGPEIVIEGPAKLRLESSTAATVVEGKVVFRAYETAPPFDLHTPSSTLVDLGTEYAVVVGPEGEEVHVFDGQVQRKPNPTTGVVQAEQLKAGQARRYGPSPAVPGRPTTLAPDRFVRQLADPGPPAADPEAGLLAYEGFDYRDPATLRLGQANGGFGWASPWKGGFVRPLNPGDRNLLTLNVNKGLARSSAAVPAAGGCFEYTGFTKTYRRLATPIRLDIDGVYYLSFLFRRSAPKAESINALALLLWTDEDFKQNLDGARLRLNIGVGGANELFTHLQQVGSRTPLPLNYGETYLLVAKIVASKSNPDQVFMRVYSPTEPIERAEPGSWSVVGPPFQSDLVFDWLQLHINSKTRQTIDELRLGTTWSSVTAAWSSAPKAGKHEKR